MAFFTHKPSSVSLIQTELTPEGNVQEDDILAIAKTSAEYKDVARRINTLPIGYELSYYLEQEAEVFL